MQLTGLRQKRVLLTPKRAAVGWISLAGIGPSSSWFASVCWYAVCSFRFQRTSTPATCWGRLPCQYGFRRSDVSSLTTFFAK